MAKKRGKRPGLRARSVNARSKSQVKRLKVQLPGVAVELSHPQSGSADAEGGTPVIEDIDTEATLP